MENFFTFTLQDEKGIFQYSIFAPDYWQAVEGITEVFPFCLILKAEDNFL